MPKTKKFLNLLRIVGKQYTGKKVPLKYRSRYGKVYSKKESEQVAYAIAKSMGWRS